MFCQISTIKIESRSNVEKLRTQEGVSRKEPVMYNPGYY